MICLVTDRRRLAPGTSPDVARARIVAQARDAVDAGIDLIQIRERDLDTQVLSALVADVLAVARGSRTRVVVNDRLDVALACRADGVHLRADSIPAAAARRIVPDGFLIGQSVHAVNDLNRTIDTSSIDYLVAGSVFPSASKPEGHPLLGVEGLRAVVAGTSLPVLAIGGIDADRLEAVAGTGACGFAAIGLFIRDGPTMKRSAEGARLRFDTAQRAP